MSIGSAAYELLDQRFPLLFCALAAIGAAGLVRGRGNGKGKGGWAGHLARLRHTNGVAVAVFVLSAAKIAIEADLQLEALLRLKLWELLLPSVGILASLTYLFGFFGISFVSQAYDEAGDAASVSRPLAAEPEVIVIGGGVVGCTTALSFAKQGRRVILFERDLSEPDRIVGELLQPGGIRVLERLGIADCAKDNIGSIYVRGYAIIEPPTLENPRTIQCLYPDVDPCTYKEYFGVWDESAKDVPRPTKDEPRGRSFHHGRFVQALRNKCLEHQAIDVVEGTVVRLLEEKGCIVGVEYKKTKSGATISADLYTQYAPLTMIADGIGSGFRKQLSDTESKSVSSWVGVIVKHPEFKPPVPHPNFGHVILARPAPILIYQISPTETRVLVDILGKLPSAATGELHRFLREQSAPQLPEIFREAFLQAVDEGDFKSMPSKLHSARSPLKRGALLIGDALNMRNPLTGGGMTVGMKDAEALGRLMSTVDDFTNYPAVLAAYDEFLTRRQDYASTVNVLADALHSVFTVPGEDKAREDMRKACFDYLQQGGFYSAGPTGLLAGLTPRADILATHFFMVALYGMKQIFLREPSLGNLLRVYRLLHVACKIIMPLLTMERATVLAWWPIRKTVNLLFPWEKQ